MKLAVDVNEYAIRRDLHTAHLLIVRAMGRTARKSNRHQNGIRKPHHKKEFRLGSFGNGAQM